MKQAKGDNVILNVEDCVKLLAERRGITLVEADAIFNDCMLVLTDAILKGGVSIRHLFTIRKSKRSGRRGEIQGREFVSKDLYTLKIRVGKKLSEMLN